MRHDEPLGFRATMLLPIVFFAPGMIIRFLSPDLDVSEVIGIVFHLAMFLVVGRLPAPEWAKAAGYGWLTLDVLSGVLAINVVPFEVSWPVRLGGHVLAGMWIIMASLACRPASVRVLGVVIGLWLALYSFFGTVLPEALLGPPALLVIIWLGLLARYGAEATRPRVASAP